MDRPRLESVTLSMVMLNTYACTVVAVGANDMLGDANKYSDLVRTNLARIGLGSNCSNFACGYLAKP